MRDWSWIQNIPQSWGFFFRVIVKALVLFGLCNLVFAWLYPLEWIGQFSLYGIVYPARERLPYGENPSESYNVSLNNLSAMFASHAVSKPYSEDEFRIFLIGDSNTWGWLLENENTLAGQINSAGMTINGQNIVAYNLGYPVMSLTKDLLILDEAMQYEPDMIIWLVSLASFPPEEQLFPPLVQQNRTRYISLQSHYDIDESYLDNRCESSNEETNASFNLWDFELLEFQGLSSPMTICDSPDLWQRTIVGQRRSLADLLRLQSYGLSWTATGIDQTIPESYAPRQSDFEAEYSWENYPEPAELTVDDLAFDVLSAGINRAGDIPVLIVNEPVFISAGQNSDIRYNSFYPRWAYDPYRMLFTQMATDNQWHYVDLWDSIDPDEFTDSPVHLSAEGTRELARLLTDLMQMTED